MITPEQRREFEQVAGDAIRFDVPTSRHTSLRVGGPADALATPPDRPTLAALLQLCARHRLPHIVLGNGFNTIVRDGGLSGLVIRLKRFRRLEERPDAGLLAESGVSHASLTRFCEDRGLGGLEFGAGIPGTVGGWLAMNAGVPERETRHVVREIEVMSPTGLRRRRIPAADLCFRYRSLRGLAPGSVILGALLSVTPSTPGAVKHAIDRHLAKRSKTQPLDVPSCGSVFKNPRGKHAGRLIEEAGLKGTRIGGAEISPLHANFFVNRGGARAEDVLALIEVAQRTVFQRTGVRLATEVRILGRQS